MRDIASAAVLSLDVDLTISIVTWNSAADIGNCLASLAGAVGGLTWAAIVVDNASTDRTAAIVREASPAIRLLVNERNVGFGPGHNLAIRSGVGRRHLVLNPDTVCHPGSLEQMAHFLDDHPQVAFVGPRVLEPDGKVYPSCRSLPTPGALIFRNRILSGLFPNNPYTRGYLMGGIDHSRAAEAGWLSGSCLMVSRGALETIGLLDERFFMYCEDMDWCRRAHDQGWQVFYEPAATITHLRGRSSDQKIPQMLIEHHRSMWKYYCKHERSRRPAWWTAGVGLAIASRAVLLVLVHYYYRMRGIARRR